MLIQAKILMLFKNAVEILKVTYQKNRTFSTFKVSRASTHPQNIKHKHLSIYFWYFGTSLWKMRHSDLTPTMM